MGKRYEYTTASPGWSRDPMEVLQERGEEGWKLCAVGKEPSANGYPPTITYYLMREKEQAA